MTRTTEKTALAAGTALLAAAAIATVLVAPARWQWVLYIAEAGANEVVFPVGYWLAVLAWVLLVTRAVAGPWRVVAWRAVGVGVALHVLLLLATLAPRLAAPELFSTSMYWRYARLFSALGLALATWASATTLRGLMAGRGGLTLIDLPVTVGTVVLGVALMRYDRQGAVAGLVLGGAWSVLPGRFAPWWSALRSRMAAVWASERFFLLAAFAVAVVLRLLYLRQVMTNPGYLETGADGPVYDELAWSIVRGHGIRESFTNRFPLLLLGYVWFVAAIYSVVGHSYFVLCALQGVIGAVACLVLYVVAKDLFGVPVARVATLFAVVNFPLLFAAAAIGHQAVDVLLTLLLVWWLMRATRGQAPSWPAWFGIGLLFGAAIAVRETVVFLLAFVIVWLPFAFKRRGWRGSVFAVTALALGVAVFLAPLVVPKVSSHEKRASLRVHLDRLYVGEADIDAIRTQIARPLSAPQEAAAQLLREPALVLGTLGRAYARNFAFLFFTQPYGGFDLVFLSKGSQYYYGLWCYVYLLTGAGIVMAMRGLRRPGTQAIGLALVLGVVLSRTLPHVVLESSYRHRAPIEPFLILLAAVAVVGFAIAARPAGEVRGPHTQWQ